MSDIAIRQVDGFFDFDLKDGDFVLTEGFDTAIKMSFFGEVRADESEMPNAILRRGWAGNLLNDDTTYQYGSKLWLLESARLNQDSVNRAITYTQEGFTWFLTDKFAQDVFVDATQTLNNIEISIQIIRNNDVVENFSFNLWENTFTNGN